MGPVSIDRKYFLTRSNAEILINLVNYLNDNEFEEEQLENKKVLKTIISKGMRMWVNQPPPLLYLNTFKSTILTFTIDYLKAVNLYRINNGVLLVGCVEYLLFPGTENRELKKIYRCGYTKAKKMYNKLCGFPEQKEQNDNIAIAAKSFFECKMFENVRKSDVLKTIRHYLRGLEIDSNELQFIRTKSIEVIEERAAKVISQLSVHLRDHIEDNLLPSAPKLSVSKSVNHKSILPNSIKIIKKAKPLLITREYLNAKCNAEVIINLQEYLIIEEVEKENLDDINLLRDIIRKGMKRFVNAYLRPIQLNTLKLTLLHLTPDYLKAIHLYRMNLGVLLVVCVEILLRANEGNENYLMIYRCEQPRAVKEYNKLRNLPVNQEQPVDIAKSARCFFHCDMFLKENGCLKVIRSYLKAIADYIDNDELSYVRDTSIKFIHDHAAKNRVEPTQNNIDPIEAY